MTAQQSMKRLMKEAAYLQKNPDTVIMSAKWAVRLGRDIDALISTARSTEAMRAENERLRARYNASVEMGVAETARRDTAEAKLKAAREALEKIKEIADWTPPHTNAGEQWLAEIAEIIRVVFSTITPTGDEPK